MQMTHFGHHVTLAWHDSRSRGRDRGRGHAFAVLAAMCHIGSRINAYCPALAKINLFQVLNFRIQVPAKYPVPADRIPHDAATSMTRCRSASMPPTGGADNPQLNLGGNTYLTKTLQSRPSYSVWGKVMRLSEYDKVIGTYKMYILDFRYRWP